MADQIARPAWYATRGGGWRDWVTVLHLPYTAWHLSYVLIGAGLAPRVDGERLAATLVGFGLAVGVSAHALDELRGRPLGTSIPSKALLVAAVAGLAGAVAIGAVGVTRLGWPLEGFIGAGVLLVVGYNLELWGGRLHTDATFAVAWGAFPVLTSYYAQTRTVHLSAAIGSVAAYALSRAQRTLSSETKLLRRRTVRVVGERVDIDGSMHDLSRESLLQPLERALVALSWSTCALGVAVVVAHAGG